jgi:hypothetical protein
MNPKNIIIITTAISLLLASPCLTADLNDGLVGYWSFDDGTATDQSGNGNDGTIYGATLVAGISEQALDFDGSNDYVLIPHDSTINFEQTDDFSVVLWFKTAWVPGNDYLLLEKWIGGMTPYPYICRITYYNEGSFCVASTTTLQR